MPPKAPKKSAKSRKRSRAPRGTGSVFFSAPRGRWVAKRPVGKAPGGRTVYLTRTGATMQEAIRRRDAALPPDPAGATVAQWADRWVESSDVREQSRDLYRDTVRLRIKPLFGHRLLSEVTPYDVEAAARAWGEKVGANTVRKYLGHAKTMFAAAERAGLVARNPVKLAKKPRAARVEIDPFTEDELRRIVAAASAEPRCHRLAVMAATGCRIGEAIALDQPDYDPATGLLRIERTATLSHGVGPPKSPNSLRTIRVPAAARAAAAALGPRLIHQCAGRRWRALLKRLAIRYRNPHQSRHSVATHAIAAGVPLANVARDLGDAMETIVRVYAHATAGRDVCEAMDGLLGGDKVTKKAGKTREVPKKSGRRKKAS